ncbi:hydrolase [Psychromonas marina]|uniref:Hydrolase n=1 Tax=Psychromonas marina TaxID=88364 RepID=A0ABQ6E4F2_9GAMM|nr:hydrolase [Psychromonas marina]GLS92055.1 hydrolase [Psychromonas marina]
MLNPHNTGLIIIDVQGKLVSAMHESDSLLRHIEVLIKGCQLLNLPIIWLEQNPQGLGPTVIELSELLTTQQPITKHSFNGCDNRDVIEAIKATGKQQWLVCGIEAHICVYQTCRGLLAEQYEVEVVQDCISSRSQTNIELALGKLQRCGLGVTNVEMCLFELIKDSREQAFKQLLALIK